MTTVATGPVAESVVTPRDRVRWGPVWAGVVTTISIFFVLELLFYGFGWVTISINPSTGVVTTNQSAGWITAVLGLISFFIGGWITQLTSSVRGPWEGILHGFIMWALSMVLIFAVSAVGFGTAFAYVNPSQINVAPSQVTSVATSTALWAGLFMILSAIAAILGGWVGDLGRIGYVAPTGIRGTTTTTTRQVTP